MSLFLVTLYKVRGLALTLQIVLQKPVEQWAREQVLRWLGDIGMEKYNDKFKGVSGKATPFIPLPVITSRKSALRLAQVQIQALPVQRSLVSSYLILFSQQSVGSV